MAREDKITLERAEMPAEDEKKGDIAETILNDIFGRKKRETKEAKKDEDYYAYDEDSDYDGFGNTSQFKFFVIVIRWNGALGPRQ